jgi:FdhE protein
MERQIEGFRSKEYVDVDWLLLWGKIVEVQEDLEGRIDCRETCPFLDRESIKERNRKGLPALDMEALCLDEAVLRELLRRVSELPLKGTAHGAVRQLLWADRSGKISLSEFVKRSMVGDWERLRTFGLETKGEQTEGFGLLALILAAPFLRCCARALPAIPGFEYESSASCPVCGGLPLMARLRREDGKRLLECSVCRFSWFMDRLKCPFCGNTDPQTLDYFFDEAEAAFRVDTCEVCRGYIKTVDERKLDDEGPVILALTDLGTLYLDLLAERKGYQVQGRDRTGEGGDKGWPKER